VKDLTIIICAFNEEKTVCQVVQACRDYNPESEILVVDDGSTDETALLLRKLNKTVPFRYLRLSQNQGKSYAMCHGILNATNDIILFFDADSYGIKEEHFRDMLKPIITNEADMVLGHTSANLMNLKLTPFKSFTGERVLHKRDILPLLDEIKDLRFGIETYINYYFQTHGKRIKYVHLNGLHTLTKFGKRSLKEATVDYFKEGNEIATTILRNYFPLSKVTRNTLTNTSETLRLKFFTIQGTINKKFQDIIDKISIL
jgi:glycosyltransferase involved in cell wall biosynthesis